MKIITIAFLLILFSSIAYAGSTITTETQPGQLGAAASGTSVSLYIYDDTESAPAQTGQVVGFYAEYSNGSIGDYADCDISFNLNGTYGEWQPMTYGVTSARYEHYRIFDDEGNFNFMVRCGMADCPDECCSCLQTSDDFTIVEQQQGTPVPEFSQIGIIIMIAIIALEVVVLFRKK